MFGDLESRPHSDLRGEGNADGSAGAEEISERAGRNQQLIRVCNRHVASWSRAERRSIVEIVHRGGQSRYVGDIVGAGVVTVEQIEELDERHDLPALSDLEGPGNAQIDLDRSEER